MITLKVDIKKKNLLALGLRPSSSNDWFVDRSYGWLHFSQGDKTVIWEAHSLQTVFQSAFHVNYGYMGGK